MRRSARVSCVARCRHLLCRFWAKLRTVGNTYDAAHQHKGWRPDQIRSLKTWCVCYSVPDAWKADMQVDVGIG